MDAASEALFREIEPRLTNMTREKIGTLVVPRPPQAVVEDFLRVKTLTPDCADALEEFGVYDHAIPASVLRPIVEGVAICGPALTILNAPGSSGHWPYEFTDIFQIAQPGDVIVISGGGYKETGSWGGTTTSMAVEKGLAGTVLDYHCRDREVLLEKRYPVWARGLTPLPTKRYLVTVAIMVPVVLQGVLVRPGDLVCADMSGVVIIPQERISEVHAHVCS